MKWNETRVIKDYLLKLKFLVLKIEVDTMEFLWLRVWSRDMMLNGYWDKQVIGWGKYHENTSFARSSLNREVSPLKIFGVGIK